MNARELAANPRLARWFVRDLNREPTLPLDDNSFDGTCLCVSVQYLQRPVGAYMREAGLSEAEERSSTPRSGDPLWTVIGTK